jgi:outer membrane protein OmpA-like peptidoglycan-associated protein
LGEEVCQRSSLTLFLLALAIAAIGCGPDRNRVLEATQREYQHTRADPVISEHASGQLAKVGDTLDQAEAAAEEGDEEDARHLTQLAQTELERTKQIARAGQAEDTSQSLERELAALQARVTKRGIMLTLSDVFFQVDSAQLRPEGVHALTQLASFLNAHPDRALTIEGHADSTGTDQYNQQLSERRAASVQSFLARSGVNPSRLVAQGFGERFPVASNATTQGRAMNRRVEMLVLNPGETVRVSRVPTVRYYESTTIQ